MENENQRGPRFHTFYSNSFEVLEKIFFQMAERDRKSLAEGPEWLRVSRALHADHGDCAEPRGRKPALPGLRLRGRRGDLGWV